MKMWQCINAECEDYLVLTGLSTDCETCGRPRRERIIKKPQ